MDNDIEEGQVAVTPAEAEQTETTVETPVDGGEGSAEPSPEEPSPEQQAFKDEYLVLCKKHGMQISGMASVPVNFYITKYVEGK